MRVKLWRYVSIHWPGTVVLEFCNSPLARGHRWIVATHARLNVLLHLIKGDIHAFPMRLPHTFVAAYQSCDAHALRCAEGRIPSGPVLHRIHRFAVFVGVFARRPVPYQLLACYRMLAFGKPGEVVFIDLTTQAPLCRKLSVPLTADLVGFGVVVLAGVLELRPDDTPAPGPR